jgi:glycosyltransferase involved in cell wall biosynthesis
LEGRVTKRLISVIVPVYNEEENVERAYAAIVVEFKKIADAEYEIIFTDNHSTDSTFQKLEALVARDPQVKVLRFARNFGFNRSILTGYRYASGDAAIQIDCDLEDPPGLFHEFIRLWRAGHDVVVGIRAQRTERAHMILARRSFYWLLDSISEVPHQIDAGDFRLVDRRILTQLQQIGDAQPYVRGLISELARNQIGVPYARRTREFGESKFPLRELVKLAFDGMFAYSIVPLRLATYLGVVIAIVTVVMILFYSIGGLFFAQDWPAGFATTTILILFGISLNSIFLGIIGEYIARIYNQIRARPTVVIERALNVDDGGERRSLKGACNGLQ